MFGDENIIEWKVDDSNIKRAGWHLPSSISYMEDIGCTEHPIFSAIVLTITCSIPSFRAISKAASTTISFFGLFSTVTPIFLSTFKVKSKRVRSSVNRSMGIYLH